MHHLSTAYFDAMKKMQKFLLLTALYSIPALLFTEVVLGIKHRTFKIRDNSFYTFLNKIGYTDSEDDPYAEFIIQHINPHFTFWFPLDPAKRSQINNYKVSLNEDGYRTTLPVLRNSSTSKDCLLVLGGSTAFGHGSSSDDNTIASNLQKLLGANTNVFNLGVPSWNSYQELLSVQRFISKDVFSKCARLDTISITSSNDIGVLTEYMQPNSKYSDYLNFLVSAPESFTHLDSKVEDIRSVETIAGSIKNMTSAVTRTFLGNTLKAIEVRIGKIRSYSDTMAMSHTELSNNQVSFITEQANSFWRNQSTISYITRNVIPNNPGTHLVVLQPSLLNLETSDSKSLRRVANDSIDLARKKQFNSIQNMYVLDARKLWSDDPDQQTSLFKLYESESKAPDNALGLHFFDDV